MTETLPEEIQRVLDGAPSPQGWDMICAWVDERFEASPPGPALAQLNPALRRWPATLRTTPHRWLQPVSPSEANIRRAQLGLTRTLWWDVTREESDAARAAFEAAGTGPLEALIEGDMLNHIEHVRLVARRHDDVLLHALWTAENLRNVRTLHLRATQRGGMRLKFLGARCGLRSLWRLDLSGSRFDAITGAPPHGWFTAEEDITFMGARHIASGMHVPSLAELRLSQCGLEMAGLAQLLDAPFLSTIQVLDVSQCGLSIPTLERLCQLPALELLHAQGSRADGEAFRQLIARHPHLRITSTSGPRTITLTIFTRANREDPPRKHLTGRTATIGTSSQDTIYCVDANIVGAHATLSWDDDALWLSAREDARPVYVLDRAGGMEPVDGAMRVFPGDVFCIGDHIFLIELTTS